MKNLFVVSICFLNIIGLAKAGLSELPNLESITFFERTGGLYEYTFDVSSTTLLNRQTTLNSSSYDFDGASTEFYDVFYSNSDGSYNSDGYFITIEAVFSYGQPHGGGLNISGVSLNFTDFPTEYADTVIHYLAMGGNSNIASVINAVDSDLATYTVMGNTIGESQRLSLTVSFASIPEPATLSLLTLGAILAGRRRKTRA